MKHKTWQQVGRTRAYHRRRQLKPSTLMELEGGLVEMEEWGDGNTGGEHGNRKQRGIAFQNRTSES